MRRAGLFVMGAILAGCGRMTVKVADATESQPVVDRASAEREKTFHSAGGAILTLDKGRTGELWADASVDGRTVRKIRIPVGPGPGSWILERRRIDRTTPKARDPKSIRMTGPDGRGWEYRPTKVAIR